MKKDNCQISLKIQNKNQILADIVYNENKIYSDIFISPTPEISYEYFFPWLVIFTKTIYSLPLSADINISFLDSLEEPNTLDLTIKKTIQIIQTTRENILKYKHLKSETKSFDSHLFLNLGEVPFLFRIYKKACHLFPHKSYYSPCNFLNNLDEDKNYSLLENTEFGDGLVQIILNKKIRYIYTHNITYLRFFFEERNIDLSVLLEHIGVELVIIDFDIYSEREGEYLLKKMTQNNNFRRFSIFPNIDAFWDHHLHIKTHYFQIPYDINKQNVVKILEPDFNILVTSWSRTENILHFIKPILLFLSYVDASKPFWDFQFLFHSLSYLLKYKLELPLLHKMRYFTLLSEIYFHTNSLLKFEVLHKIKTQRKIHLYGDKQWENFFPQFYKGEANQNDLKIMLKSKSYLQILMNANYNYFENNPMFIRLLNSNNPYLGFSSILKTPELEGFSKLEFSNVDELNHKIESINDLTSSPEFVESRACFADQNNQCVDDFFNQIFITKSEQKNNYEYRTLQYHELFEKNLESSFLSNKDRFQECLSRIIREDFHSLDPTKSALMDRPYFQVLLTLQNSSKASVF